MKGSIDSIETFGLVDGPGIRTVVFLTGCKLRCKYCHNPEMWTLGKMNFTPEELVAKLIRNKPYWKRNHGGVTFSGGEPLLQSKFLIETCKLLKQEQVHIALDTAGVGNGDYEEILPYIDLIIFDVKQITEEGYFDLTGQSMEESLWFIEVANHLHKKFWIRQVIVPGIMDRETYMEQLVQFLTKIKNIERVDFLPYHKLGSEKYEKLGIENPYREMVAMDQKRTDALYQYFMKIWNETKR